MRTGSSIPAPLPVCLAVLEEAVEELFESEPEEPVDLLPLDDMVEEPLGLLPAAPPDVPLPDDEVPLVEEEPPDMVLLLPETGAAPVLFEPETGATGATPPAGTVAAVGWVVTGVG